MYNQFLDQYLIKHTRLHPFVMRPTGNATENQRAEWLVKGNKL